MASPRSSAGTLTLHIWPPYESALSIDPPCVAALLYIQAALPGRFSVAYCNNPDVSPSGQLPYLTHGLHSVASFSSIVKYVSHLEHARDLDVHLSTAEKAQCSARVAHIESELGDLVAYVYYALSTNWVERTHPMLVSLLPIPQRWYVPKRIRESYRPRLEAAEMWNAEGVADEEEEEKLHFTFRRAPKKNKKALAEKKKRHVFARDKVLEKARAFFDIYAKLLGNNTFFYKADGPTTLDVVLAAYVHLLQQPLPDTLIRDLLAESYQKDFLEHAHNVYDYAFNPALPTPPTVPHSTSFSLSFIIPSFSSFWKSKPARSSEDTKEESTEVLTIQRRFAFLRWGFYALVFVTMAAYFRLSDLRRQQIILTQARDGTRALRLRRGDRDEEEEADEGQVEMDAYEDDDEE